MAVQQTRILVIFLALVLVFYLGQLSSSPSTPITPSIVSPSSSSATKEDTKSDGGLVMYVYYESEPAVRNLQFFLEHALHANVDFLFIINGHNCSVPIPELPNVRVVRRDNTCFDLGASGELLKSDPALLKYKRYIFTNASIRGPFLPAWANVFKACWTEIIWGHLSDTVKLAGLTANCDPTYSKHVQSIMLATDRAGLDIIMPALQCQASLWEAVLEGELKITDMVREAGYEAMPIFSIRPTFGKQTNDFWNSCDFMDVFYEGRMSGSDVIPYDTIFVKTKRTVQYPGAPPLPFGARGQKVLDILTDWADKSNYSSYDYC